MYIHSVTALLLLSAVTPTLASPVPAPNHHGSVVKSDRSHHLATRNLLTGDTTYDKKYEGEGKTLSLLHGKLTVGDINLIIKAGATDLQAFLLQLDVHTIDDLVVKVDLNSLPDILHELHTTIGNLLATLECSLPELLTKLDLTLLEFLLEFELTSLELLLAQIPAEVLLDLSVELGFPAIHDILHTYHININTLLDAIHLTFGELCLKLKITSVDDLLIAMDVKTLSGLLVELNISLGALLAELDITLGELLVQLKITLGGLLVALNTDLPGLLVALEIDLSGLLVALDIDILGLLVALDIDLYGLLVVLDIDLPALLAQPGMGLDVLLIQLNLTLDGLCKDLNISIEELFIQLEINSLDAFLLHLKIKNIDDLLRIIEIKLWGKILVVLNITIGDLLAKVNFTVEGLLVRLGLTLEVFYETLNCGCKPEAIGLDIKIGTSIGA